MPIFEKESRLSKAGSDTVNCNASHNSGGVARNRAYGKAGSIRACSYFSASADDDDSAIISCGRINIVSAPAAVIALPYSGPVDSI